MTARVTVGQGYVQRGAESQSDGCEQSGGGGKHVVRIDLRAERLDRPEGPYGRSAWGRVSADRRVYRLGAPALSDGPHVIDRVDGHADPDNIGVIHCSNLDRSTDGTREGRRVAVND